MRREDIEKLLGGYATGTLTDSERQALFQAALTDQELFDSLMREEALREMLADPQSRRQIASAVEAPTGVWPRFFAWFRTPAGWAFAGSAFAVLALTAVLVRVAGVDREPSKAEFALAKKKEAAPAAPAAVAEIAPPAQAPAATVQPKPSFRQAEPPPRTEPPARQFVPPAEPATRAEEGKVRDMPQPPELEIQAKVVAPPAEKTAGGVGGGGGGAAVPGPLAQSALPPPPPPAVTRTLAVAGASSVAPIGARELFYGRALADEADAERNARADAALERRAAVPSREMAKSRDVRTNLVGVSGLGLRYSLEGRRLTLQSNQPARLYVFGPRGLLYTSALQAGRDHTYEVPPAEASVSILLDRGREPLPEALLARARSQARAGGFLTQTVDNVTYVVNPASGPDARVMVEVRVR